MIILWSIIGITIILFGVVLWSYLDDLKKSDDYYLSSYDLDKFRKDDI